MSTGRGKGETGGEMKETKDSDEKDIDSLFELPLTEFTTARNVLAARLKKAGHGDKAAKVKALVKPSISAWAVNQLYWRQNEAFDSLMDAGRRFREAQISQFAGKAADIHGAQAARREALSILSRLADELLRTADHNPTPDTMRRINTTLEALSIYSPGSDIPPPGRLTEDVNPAGFESVAALIPTGGPVKPPAEPKRVVPFRPTLKHGPSRQEEKESERIAAAKAALQDAEQALGEARIRVEDLAAARKRAAAQVNETEQRRFEADELFQKARLAEQEARKRLQSVTAEAEKAARVMDDAARAVEKARKELSSPK